MIKSENKKVCLISFGPCLNQIINSGIDATVINAIFNYPINEKVLMETLDFDNVIIYDPYGTENGFTMHVNNKLNQLGYKGKIINFALPNDFIKKGSVEQQKSRYGVDVKALLKVIEDIK